jgi:hypothetical protein
MALVHFPVLNRKGEIIASAMTNLDLHDLGRLAATYAIAACYVVTPLEDQQELMRRLIDHWCLGIGRELHPDRHEALKRLHIVNDLDAAKRDIEAFSGRRVTVWATSARDQAGALPHRQARGLLAHSDQPHLLLFGTGWGLAPSLLDEVDATLEAISGPQGYNHLSVRCAAAIIIDRLLSGERVF